LARDSWITKLHLVSITSWSTACELFVKIAIKKLIKLFVYLGLQEHFQLRNEQLWPAAHVRPVQSLSCLYKSLFECPKLNGKGEGHQLFHYSCTSSWSLSYGGMTFMQNRSCHRTSTPHSPLSPHTHNAFVHY